MTRLSCQHFRSNYVRLLRSVITYDLGKPVAAAIDAPADERNWSARCSKAW